MPYEVLWHMSSVDDRWILSVWKKKVEKKIKMQIFLAIFGFTTKMYEMSSSIGSVVLEFSFLSERKYSLIALVVFHSKTAASR